MSQTVAALIPAAVDYERTLVLAIEVSNKSWVLADLRRVEKWLLERESLSTPPCASQNAMGGFPYSTGMFRIRVRLYIFRMGRVFQRQSALRNVIAKTFQIWRPFIFWRILSFASKRERALRQYADLREARCW